MMLCVYCGDEAVETQHDVSQNNGEIARKIEAKNEQKTSKKLLTYI